MRMMAAMVAVRDVYMIIIGLLDSTINYNYVDFYLEGTCTGIAYMYDYDLHKRLSNYHFGGVRMYMYACGFKFNTLLFIAVHIRSKRL